MEAPLTSIGALWDVLSSHYS